MTVIAALRHNNTVYMAADTASVDGFGRIWPDHTKLQRIELAPGLPAVVGSAGHRGLGKLAHRLLHDSGDPGRHHDNLDAWAQAFADQLATAAREPGPKYCDTDGYLDGRLLLTYRLHTWTVGDDGADRVDGLTTIGSGGDLALGALLALTPLIETGDIDPADALRQAVRIAGTYDNNCSTTAVVMDATAGAVLTPGTQEAER